MEPGTNCQVALHPVVRESIRRSYTDGLRSPDSKREQLVENRKGEGNLGESPWAAKILD